MQTATDRGRTTGGRGGRAVRLALAAALLPAALLPSTTAAQRPAAPPRPSAPPAPPERGDAAMRALSAELADLQRRRAEAAGRLERFAATLRRRETTSIVHDSLLLLVREHAELSTRASLVAARMSLREAERDARRDVRDAERQTRQSMERSRVEVRGRVRPTSAAPEGWFGVNVEQRPSSAISARHVLTVAEYPRVLSVEPASPAARAGVQAGDRLVAIAGIDLRENSVDLARLLRPGRTLPVRIARDGRLQEVRVAVTSKPRTFVSGVTVSVTTDDAARRAAPDAPRAVTVAPRPVVRGAAPAPAPARVGAPPSPPSPPSPLTLFYRSPNVALLAGAEVVHLPAELRAALGDGERGSRGGVLVVQVARGSMAERAGLRGGDVLLRANGRDLTSPDVLQRVARQASAGESQVRLELLRDRRTRTITLRW